MTTVCGAAYIAAHKSRLPSHPDETQYTVGSAGFCLVLDAVQYRQALLPGLASFGLASFIVGDLDRIRSLGCE